MAAAELSFEVSGLETFDRVSAALSDAEGSLPDGIRKELSGVAQRLANIARRAVLEEPTHTDRHTGLRAQVSSGVSVVETPEGVTVNTSMPESDEAIIPRGLDNRTGWRHPIFGNREGKWVVQHGAFSWFLDSMQGGRSDAEQNLERLLNETAEKIAAAGD